MLLKLRCLNQTKNLITKALHICLLTARGRPGEGENRDIKMKLQQQEREALSVLGTRVRLLTPALIRVTWQQVCSRFPSISSRWFET